MEKRPKMPDKHRCVRPFVGDGSNELTDANLRLARKRWGPLKPQSVQNLKTYSQEFGFSITAGDLILLDNGWHVTNTGLIRLARRKHCGGIDVKPVAEFSSTTAGRWAFRATVYKSRNCRGFVGYGDADPSNVSPLVHGAEMRVAETRAVNRALRKAYGIGICSVEEIGSFAEPVPSSRESKKLPPQPVKWELRRPQGPRPPLPDHPPVPARSKLGQSPQRRTSAGPKRSGTRPGCWLRISSGI
jgi:hypothetical protein